MIVSFRPLTAWMHGDTYPRRGRGTFSVGLRGSVLLLEREIEHLDGGNVIIGAFLSDDDIRNDGWPRAGVRTPPHPGIEISFDSRHGRLVYATDVCSWWEHNVRSIALGLEALRAVDRYGVSRKGEQYAGWKQLSAGSAGGLATADDAWKILHEAAGLGNEGPMILARYDLQDVYRMAAKKTHPDTGGNGEAFARVSAAYDFLKASA